jgi:diadenosine tetraphosphate (Ap4A) HIT family hydrolase
MPTLFTRIIEGDIPGTFVWRDDLAVAFLSINPLNAGHTLVVPRVETDHWLDLDLAVAQHCIVVSQFIGKAQQEAFKPTRVALLILGLEVPHVHLHVVPIWAESDVNFANAARSVERDDLEAAAEAIRSELRAQGHAEASA